MAAVAVAAVVAVEVMEDNLLAKAADNESVDGRMMACDDEIGRWTTMQQPTNERRRDGGGSDGSATARGRRQRGGSSAAAAAVAAARKRYVGGRLLSVGQNAGPRCCLMYFPNTLSFFPVMLSMLIIAAYCTVNIGCAIGNPCFSIAATNESL